MSAPLSAGGNMPCPKCGGVTRVTDTRPYRGERPALRRKRICQSCPNRFPTVEIALTELATTEARIRFRIEMTDRYLALNESGQAAVRQLITSLEAGQAAVRQIVTAFGSPQDKAFADGGVLPPGKPYLVGERP